MAERSEPRSLFHAALLAAGLSLLLGIALMFVSYELRLRNIRPQAADVLGWASGIICVLALLVVPVLLATVLAPGRTTGVSIWLLLIVGIFLAMISQVRFESDRPWWFNIDVFYALLLFAALASLTATNVLALVGGGFSQRRVFALVNLCLACVGTLAMVAMTWVLLWLE